MMTSKGDIEQLCSLSFVTTADYAKNLERLLSLMQESQKGSLIVAPEVCLSGFDYDNFEAAAEFSATAKEALLEASEAKSIVVSMIEKREGEFFNMLYVFHKGKIVHQRAKVKLFVFGGEHNYFTAGEESDIALFEIEGVKIGVLICFELRFKHLWKQLEGADIIVVPSWWGVLRSEHFKVLTQALAIMNQCYVVASDSLNEECSKMSAIITPQGEVTYNGNMARLEQEYKAQDIALMRRYLDVGIG